MEKKKTGNRGSHAKNSTRVKKKNGKQTTGKKTVKSKTVSKNVNGKNTSSRSSNIKKENPVLEEKKKRQRPVPTTGFLDSSTKEIPKETSISEPSSFLEAVSKKETLEDAKPKKKSEHFFHRNWWKILLGVLLFLLFSTLIVYKIFFDIIRKDVYLELGKTEITVNDFLKKNVFFKKEVLKNSQILTNLKKVDWDELGDVSIQLRIGKRKVTSTLHIVDTTPPKVKFQDVHRYLDYEFDANDFVQSKEDQTKMTVRTETIPEFKDFGEYPVVIIVSDTSGNETKGKCILHIGAIKDEVFLELSHSLNKEDLVYRSEDQDVVSDDDIRRVNEGGVGEYLIEVEFKGRKFTSKVIVQDTLPPELELKDVYLYDDDTEVDAWEFVSHSWDASDYNATIESEIPFGQIGEYEVVVEAIDAYQNSVQKTAKVIIRKDTDAPRIYGANSMTVNKYAKINYMNGISAYDDKDGWVDVSVNANSVNTSATGTYYATYTATDQAGNTATVKRKIYVNHDQEDLNRKVNEIASGIGSSIEEINGYVKSHIRYNSSWGDNDPVWYGLTNWKGNCYVQANVLMTLLRVKGYDARLIWVTNRTHYWVIVNIGNGVWRHTDTAYGIVMATDEERYSNLKGRDWDRSLWPEAK